MKVLLRPCNSGVCLYWHVSPRATAPPPH